ncbi:hypothetical protein [Sorangium sp. So ce513]|uniref:hypothetical protein n=1 Tax=Sorangium sp. So ce513 TaxID=3133315 RepID=UPI003F606764
MSQPYVSILGGTRRRTSRAPARRALASAAFLCDLGPPPAPAAVAIPRAELACRVGAAMAVAWVVVRSAGVVPAGLSGLLLAVPIVGNVLPSFTLPRHGVDATVALLAGFARGLLGFAAFFVALRAGIERLSPAAAYGLAWLAALLAALALRRAGAAARAGATSSRPASRPWRPRRSP